MSRPTFILLQARPASGKSTYADKLVAQAVLEDVAVTVVCPDQCRLHYCGDINDQSRNHWIFSVVCPALIRDAAAQGVSVIFDACSVTRKARAPLLELAKELGFRTEVHVLDVPLAECIRRNAARERSIPVEVIERMDRRWAAPSLDEGIDQIVIVSA